jgi:hypothetical protein
MASAKGGILLSFLIVTEMSPQIYFFVMTFSPIPAIALPLGARRVIEDRKPYTTGRDKK